MDDLTPGTNAYLEIRSKRGRQKFLQALLNRYAPGERVRSEDEPLLRLIIEKHPDVAQKCAGQAVAHFEVDRCTGGTQCFYLVRKDGKRVHFSYKKCL